MRGTKISLHKSQCAKETAIENVRGDFCKSWIGEMRCGDFLVLLAEREKERERERQTITRSLLSVYMCVYARTPYSLCSSEIKYTFSLARIRGQEGRLFSGTKE